MAFRTDVTVDYQISPRIITVASPSDEITIQDLHDTLTGIEDSIPLEGPEHPGLIESAGKEDLGGGTTVGITATMQDAQLAFQARVTELESGTVTTPDTGGVTLTDSAATFQTNNVGRGDLVYNTTDSSQASVLSVTSETVLVTNGLVGGTDNQFDTSDGYEVFDVVQCNVSGGNLVAVDTSDVIIDPIFPTFGTQIIKTSSSSATLQELGDIQHAAFESAVQVDVINGSPGTLYPAGNTANPVDNLTDAAAINAVRGFDRYNIIKSMTLGNEASWQDAVFIGHSIIDTVINVAAVADVTKTEFLTCSLEGSLGDTTILLNCFLGEFNALADVRGVIEACSIGPAKITLGGPSTATVRFVNCRGAGSQLSPPTLNCAGDGPEVDIQDYVGQLNVENKTGESIFDITVFGSLTLDASMTNGIVRVFGEGELIDNSGPNCLVVDKMLHGDQLSALHTYEGLETGNAITHTPALSSSADGTVNVSRNRQQSMMDYGTSITEVLTRIADPAILMDAPLIADLLDSEGRYLPTFTRASTGTYVAAATGFVTSAAINAARFEVSGLLLEEPRTNQLVQSEDLSTTWFNQNSTESTDVTAAPDNATTADELVEDATASAVHRIRQSGISYTSGVDYTFSSYLKQNTRTHMRLQLPTGAFGSTISGTIDLTDDTLWGSTGTPVISTESAANAFTRFGIRKQATSTTSSNADMYLHNGTSHVYTGDGSSGLYAWGMQIEPGLFPTSYIPTTTATVARSADFLSYNNDTMISDTAGSIVLRFTPLFNSTESNAGVLLNIANQLTGILYILDDTTQKFAISDGTNVANFDPTIVANTTYKVAVRWSTTLSEMQVIVDGVAGTVATYDGAFVRTLGTLYVGSDSTGNHANGNISNLKIYNNDRGEDQLKVDTG